jgi:hypothetical protein
MALCSVLGMQSVQVGGLRSRIGRSDGPAGPAGLMGVLDCTGEECCLRCILSSVGVSAIVATSGDLEQGALF